MEKITRDLVFLDTETTGVEKKDRIVQVAYKIGDSDSGVKFFKAELPVSVEAMSVCHVTNKMLEDKEKFQGSKMHSKLGDLFSSKNTVLVAHNAKFDIEMLRREGIEIENHICTFKIAQHLDPDAVIPKYNLQYLRYLLDLDIDGVAHDAMGDVFVLESLFKRLFDKFFAQKGKAIPFVTGDDALDGMIDVSKNPVLIKKFTFGKHKGKFIAYVANEDNGYLQWLYGEKMKEDIKDEDWIYTLNKYISKTSF